jgi:riboflavin biosynthesis pyrimidine reductase
VDSAGAAERRPPPNGLIDEVHLGFAPLVIGGRATPSLFDSPDLASDEFPARLELISVTERPNGRLWVHYRVLD